LETRSEPAGGARRRLLIIVNAAAGRARRSRRRLRRVVALLECGGCTVVVRTTTGAGSAETLARTAGPEFDVVVAAGGDGTVNEVANGLACAASHGGMPWLAVLPFGTANVLAQEIGLPFRVRPLARLLATGGARPVWPGLAAGRLFLTMAGSGFDADIVASVDPVLKRRLGRLAFLAAILRAFRRYRAGEIVLDIDGAEHRAVAAIVAKGRCYAGGFVLAPRAALAERAFEVVLFGRAGRLALLRALVALPLGLVPRLPEVATLRASRVALAGSGFVQIDGEIAGRLPVVIALAERPLFLLQPEAPARRPRRERV
jgi:YegS/Rv2252/BmrU family lipid kinase